MKKLILYPALILSILFNNGCKKYFDGVNDNPNDIVEASPNLLLPAIQAHLAYGVGGDISRMLSMITQQCTGVDRQWLTYQIYNLNETDTDNFWRFNLYGGPLQDLHVIQTEGQAKGYAHYEGIANVLMAYSLIVTTDCFGDIPYSDAFGGALNLTPSYDTQEEIYATIQTLLSDAQVLFAGDGGDLVPGSDDLIYGGDIAQWQKLANVLSARAHLHLGKTDPAEYAAALTALGTEGVDCFAGNGDDAVYTFGTDETAAGPWYQFNDQRGDIVFTGWMLDTMLVLNDPRVDQWVDTTGGGAGMGPFFGVPNAPFYYATYVEQKFIEAEAAFKTGDLARAALAHNTGVVASLDKLGVTGNNAAFEAAEANETAGTISLEKIMTHKYIALFTDVEVFTDWRRTNWPRLTPTVGNVTGDIIPRRLPNPQSERLYNSNAPAAPAITTSVWWDN